jgi:RNA polymerase sigma factor FliA
MMNELIESHLGYAHAIAAELTGKYPPNITRTDLERAAEFGLVEAARRYDPSRSVSFATFAYYRVRGAIFDEVRKSWQASHLKCSSEKSIPEEIADAPPRGEERASWGEFEDYMYPQSDTYLVSLDSGHAECIIATTDSPASQVLRKEESEAIQEAIRQLPKRHRFVLRAHYYEDLSLVSIGKQLNLSKSWVSRIHAQALAMLRKVLQESRTSPALPRVRSRQRRSAIPMQATFCCD